MALGLAGCASKTPQLMNAKSNTPIVGPDEFGIVPNRALQTPPDPTALPVPTPGARNLADADPTGDAIAALGGRESAVHRVAPNAPLMVAVTRLGMDANIRNELAAEDLAYRREHRAKPLERLFKSNVYFRVYAPESLDARAEAARLAALGVPVPPAPPPAK
jgi:hypothetical protein